ncbi:hypothetical protein CRUP_020599, partial [Coryphaenoides rupestris]
SSSSEGSGGVGSPESAAALASSSSSTSSSSSSGLYTCGQNCSVSQSPQPEDSASASLRGFHGNGSSSSSTMGGDGGAGVSYHHINRVLREAHFSSLQIRALPGSTWGLRLGYTQSVGEVARRSVGCPVSEAPPLATTTSCMPLNRDGRPGHGGSESQSGSLLLTPPPPRRRWPLPAIEFPLASLVLSAWPPPNSSSSSSSGLRGAFPWRWAEEPIWSGSGPEEDSRPPMSVEEVLATRGGAWWRLDGWEGAFVVGGGLVNWADSRREESRRGRVIGDQEAAGCYFLSGDTPTSSQHGFKLPQNLDQKAESSQNERSGRVDGRYRGPYLGGFVHHGPRGPSAQLAQPPLRHSKDLLQREQRWLSSAVRKTREPSVSRLISATSWTQSPSCMASTLGEEPGGGSEAPLLAATPWEELWEEPPLLSTSSQPPPTWPGHLWVPARVRE